MRHHHHFYDLNDKPAIESHDHDYDDVVHGHADWGLKEGRLTGRPIYWDHPGDNCASLRSPVRDRYFWTDG